MKKQSGFSMVELLISTAVITIIMAGVLMLSLHGQKTHITETHRGDMLQNLRFVKHLLTEKIRSAGAGISQTNLTNINQSLRNSYFLGVYPLNNANFPDGIILASGDPNCYSFVPKNQTFTPGDGIIQLDTKMDKVIMGVQESTQTKYNAAQTQPEWKKGDIGIVMANDGYYVFEVTQDPAIDDHSLVLREDPIYFSGLLNSGHYKDNYHLLNSNGMNGEQIVYPEESPIWRLDYFHIYMVVEDPVNQQRTLTLTTDTHGAADPLHPDNATMKTGVPIASNIIDFQFEYVAKNGLNLGQYDYWCSFAAVDFYGNPITSYDTPCNENPNNIDAQCRAFYDLFKDGAIRSVIVSIAVRTDEMTYKQGEAPEYQKPVMGDSGDQQYNTRHYYRDIRFEVLLRNFTYQTFYN